MRFSKFGRYAISIATGMTLLFVGLTFSQESDREAAYAQLAVDAAEADKISRIMRTAAELTFPSVVHIETTVIQQKQSAGTGNARQATSRRIEETGAGIIVLIDDKLWLVTNSHVVRLAKPNEIRLQLHDRRKATAKQVLLNNDFDIAVVEIVETDLTPARLGNSDTVQAADMVLVIGSPYGLSGSISRGIISATGRRNIPKGEHAVPLLDMLQTDAAINPGNSGGPLVNMRGEVIGVISAIASSSGANEGVGFAIPINDALRVAENLVRYGEVHRPYIGVELAREITDQERTTAKLPQQAGVKITAVTPNSPAAIAGLRVGDIIVKYNDTLVEDDSHFIRLVARANVGDQPTLTVIRFNENLTVRPVLAAQKSL